MVYAFDLDDTLYTEMDFVRSGYRAVARELAAGSTLGSEAYYEGILPRRPIGFEWALEAYRAAGGSDPDMSVDKMIEIYRAHEPDIHLRPGVRELLEKLKAEGHTLVLITDGSTRPQRSKIKALDIGRYFDDILISEETGGDKNSEVPWRLTEERYGAPGQRFVYVGDNMSKDFRIAGMRGWHTGMTLAPEGVNVFPQHIADWPPRYRPQSIWCGVDRWSGSPFVPDTSAARVHSPLTTQPSNHQPQCQ